MPLAFDRSGLSMLREVTATQVRGCGLVSHGLDRFIVGVNEVATNAVLHGAGRGWLRLWCAEGCLFAEISDDGVGLPAGFVIGPAAVSAPGGRGMWLASQCCDLTIRAGVPTGTTVELRVACPDGPPPGR